MKSFLQFWLAYCTENRQDVISEKKLPILKRVIIFPQKSESFIVAYDALLGFQNSRSEIILMFLFCEVFYTSCICVHSNVLSCKMNGKTYRFNSGLNALEDKTHIFVPREATS